MKRKDAKVGTNFVRGLKDIILELEKYVTRREWRMTNPQVKELVACFISAI